MKNIAIYCDGTWQNLSQKFPTNVTRLARATSPSVPGRTGEAVAQVVYYDDGVGVGQGVLNQATHLLGGAFGEGLDAKIAAAYEFVCLNYAPGDRLFIFGFSRGAYTARSLAGLIRKCWILRRENIGSIDQALDIYRNHSKDAVETTLFKQNFCYAAAPLLDARTSDPKLALPQLSDDPAKWGSVQYVGVWDTVGSMGVPKSLPFADALNDKYRFHDLSLSRFVLSARHAVAIDERRDTFAPTLWDNVVALNQNANAAALRPDEQPYQQSWFPGHHGSVGGGEDDGGVSISPLLWIAKGASQAGLVFDEALMATYLNAANPTADFPKVRRTIGDVILTATGEEDRVGPSNIGEVSDAARLRWQGRQDYRPAPLSKFQDALSTTVVSK